MAMRHALLSVDDIDVEAPLERNLIYLRNRDVPGVIGKVGTILGEQQSTLPTFRSGGSLPTEARRKRANRGRPSPLCTSTAKSPDAMC